MNIVEFNIDTKSIEKALENTTLKLDSIIIKMQKAVNKAVIKDAKARFKSLFNAKNHNRYTLTNATAENASGKNAKPILSNFKNTKGREKRTTWILNNAYYAGFLERGAVINAKKAKWLTFKIGGKWVKVKSVTLSARPFIKPAVEAFWNTSKSVEIQEKILQAELNKYWNK